MADSWIERGGHPIASHHGDHCIHEGGSSVSRIVTNVRDNVVIEGSSSIGTIIANVSGSIIREGSDSIGSKLGTIRRTNGHFVEDTSGTIYNLNGSPSDLVAAGLFIAARRIGS